MIVNTFFLVNFLLFSIILGYSQNKIIDELPNSLVFIKNFNSSNNDVIAISDNDGNLRFLDLNLEFQNKIHVPEENVNHLYFHQNKNVVFYYAEPSYSYFSLSENFTTHEVHKNEDHHLTRVFFLPKSEKIILYYYFRRAIFYVFNIADLKNIILEYDDSHKYYNPLDFNENDENNLIVTDYYNSYLYTLNMSNNNKGKYQFDIEKEFVGSFYKNNKIHILETNNIKQWDNENKNFDYIFKIKNNIKSWKNIRDLNCILLENSQNEIELYNFTDSSIKIINENLKLNFIRDMNIIDKDGGFYLVQVDSNVNSKILKLNETDIKNIIKTIFSNFFIGSYSLIKIYSTIPNIEILKIFTLKNENYLISVNKDGKIFKNQILKSQFLINNNKNSIFETTKTIKNIIQIDSKLIAYSIENIIYIMNIINLNITKLNDNTKDVTKIKWNEKNKFLVSSNLDGYLIFYNSSFIPNMKINKSLAINGFDFINDDNLIIWYNNNSTFEIFNIKTNKSIYQNFNIEKIKNIEIINKNLLIIQTDFCFYFYNQNISIFNQIGKVDFTKNKIISYNVMDFYNILIAFTTENVFLIDLNSFNYKSIFDSNEDIFSGTIFFNYKSIFDSNEDIFSGTIFDFYSSKTNVFSFNIILSFENTMKFYNFNMIFNDDVNFSSQLKYNSKKIKDDKIKTIQYDYNENRNYFFKLDSLNNLKIIDFVNDSLIKELNDVKLFKLLDDSEYLVYVSKSKENIINFFNYNTTKEIIDYDDGLNGNKINSIELIKFDNKLAVGMQNGEIYLLNITKLKEINSVKIKNSSNDSYSIDNLCYDNQKKTMIYSSNNLTELNIIDLNGKTIQSLNSSISINKISIIDNSILISDNINNFKIISFDGYIYFNMNFNFSSSINSILIDKNKNIIISNDQNIFLINMTNSCELTSLLNETHEEINIYSTYLVPKKNSSSILFVESNYFNSTYDLIYEIPIPYPPLPFTPIDNITINNYLLDFQFSVKLPKGNISSIEISNDFILIGNNQDNLFQFQCFNNQTINQLFINSSSNNNDIKKPINLIKKLKKDNEFIFSIDNSLFFTDLLTEKLIMTFPYMIKDFDVLIDSNSLVLIMQNKNKINTTNLILFSLIYEKIISNFSNFEGNIKYIRFLDQNSILTSSFNSNIVSLWDISNYTSNPKLKIGFVTQEFIKNTTNSSLNNPKFEIIKDKNFLITIMENTMLFWKNVDLEISNFLITNINSSIIEINYFEEEKIIGLLTKNQVFLINIDDIDSSGSNLIIEEALNSNNSMIFEKLVFFNNKINNTNSLLVSNSTNLMFFNIKKKEKSDNNDNSKFSKGLIAGIIIASIAGLIILIIMAVYFFKKMKSRKEKNFDSYLKIEDQYDETIRVRD